MAKNQIINRGIQSRYRKRKRRHLIWLMGSHCMRCGSTTNLEFSPKDANQITGNQVRHAIASRSTEEAEKLVRLCELICRDCRWKKTLTKKGMPGKVHGSITYYPFCGPPKCEACKQAKRIVNYRYRSKGRTKLLPPHIPGPVAQLGER